jgi:hypothetical protein
MKIERDGEWRCIYGKKDRGWEREGGKRRDDSLIHKSDKIYNLTLRVQSLLISIFLGFRSLCITPISCRYATPLINC